MHTHTWKTLRHTKHRLRTRQSKMIGQRKLGRNAPYKWFKLPRGWDSVSEPTRVYMYMYSFCLLINTCFFLIHFYKVEGPRPCLWPLVPGSLVTGFQSPHCRSLTSNSGQELKLSSCCRPGPLKISITPGILAWAIRRVACHPGWQTNVGVNFGQKEGWEKKSTSVLMHGQNYLNPYIPFTEKT